MNKKQKLLYVANVRMPTEKAHGVQIMNMCEAFTKAGFDVELLVNNRKTPITESVASYYGIPENIFTITRIGSLDTVRFGRIGFWLQAISFAFNVRRYMRNKEYDVLYSRDEYSLVCAPKAPIMAYEIHTNRSSLFVKKALKKMSHAIVIAQGIADFLMTQGVQKESILVAHDGVDGARFVSDREHEEKLRTQLAIGLDRKVVAYIGKTKTMGVGKGVEDIIKGFSIAYAKDPELLLLFVGVEESELGYMRDKCVRAGLSEDAYRIVGHVAPVEVPSYMQLSTFLLLYYPNIDHYRYYMSPLKLFEYMASRKVIISSRLPSIEEVLTDGVSGILVEPERPELLAEALLSICADTARQDQLIQGAYARVQEYTWDKRAVAIKKFIQNSK